MLGFLNLLKGELGGPLDPKAAGYLNDIESAATRMALLIDDLLAFSRIGRVEMRRDAVDLQPFPRREHGDAVLDVLRHRVAAQVAIEIRDVHLAVGVAAPQGAVAGGALSG